MGTYINLILYALLIVTTLAILNILFPKVWGKIKSKFKSALHLSGTVTDINTNMSDASFVSKGEMPIINVIFSTESKDEEDISKELADMFVNQRTFFYTAQSSERLNTEPNRKDDDVFVKYENVNWDALKSIEV